MYNMIAQSCSHKLGHDVTEHSTVIRSSARTQSLWLLGDRFIPVSLCPNIQHVIRREITSVGAHVGDRSRSQLSKRGISELSVSHHRHHNHCFCLDCTTIIQPSPRLAPPLAQRYFCFSLFNSRFTTFAAGCSTLASIYPD